MKIFCITHKKQVSVKVTLDKDNGIKLVMECGCNPKKSRVIEFRMVK